MPRNTPWENLVLQSDAALNDSDKTLTVPAGKQWRVKSIYAKLISTGTGGNRQMDILFTTAADVVIGKVVAGAVQAASLTREYTFAPECPQETTFTTGVMLRALPADLVLPAGYKIRVYDSAAIDAAADDLDIEVLVEERTE
jgi:hypothetical protein